MFNIIIVSITLILTAGVSFWAQYSLPWEILYPVKIYFNESLLSTFTLKNINEAKLQLKFIENRIQEINQLKYEQISDQKLQDIIEKQIITHTKLFKTSYWKLPSKNAQKEVLKFRFNNLISDLQFDLDSHIIQ